MKSTLINSNGRVVIRGDRNDREHVNSIIHIIDMYKSDKMGDESLLSDGEKLSLAQLIANHSYMEFFLVYIDEELAGGSICFEKFSSFSAKKIINIHDFCVLSDFRGIGLGRVLMSAIVDYAESINCSRVTLEVREDNRVAKNLYNSMGFSAVSPNMFFWHKLLPN